MTILIALTAVGCSSTVASTDPVPASVSPSLQPALTLAGAGVVSPILFNSDRTGNHEIFAIGPDEATARQLTADPQFDSWWARRSPDRSRILFYRTPRGVADTDYGQTSLWVMQEDGSNARMLRPRGADGWEVQGHAEWSPDGRRLVMFGGKKISSQIFVTDAEGAHPRQVTDRSGVNLDPSWSPEGRSIVFVGCAAMICFEKDYEIFSIPAAGGDARQFTSNGLRDHDPYFSPDGRFVAWLSETEPNAFGLAKGSWNIRIMDADGSNQRAITTDRQISSMPQWAPDGNRILFHRFEPGRRPSWGIFAIRPDGTGLVELLAGVPGNSEYPSF